MGRKQVVKYGFCQLLTQDSQKIKLRSCSSYYEQQKEGNRLESFDSQTALQILNIVQKKSSFHESQTFKKVRNSKRIENLSGKRWYLGSSWLGKTVLRDARHSIKNQLENACFFKELMNNCFHGGLKTNNGPNFANGGSWALEQNLAYTIFIDIHKKSMTSKKKMREMAFYDKLSAFVTTRAASQCRSHHQKLFAKFKYLSKIREIFRSEVGVVEYKSQLKKGIEKMKIIDRQWNAIPVKVEEQGSGQDEGYDVIGENEEPALVNPNQFFPFQPMMMGYGMGPMGMMGGYGWMAPSELPLPSFSLNYLQ